MLINACADPKKKTIKGMQLLESVIQLHTYDIYVVRILQNQYCMARWIYALQSDISIYTIKYLSI